MLFSHLHQYERELSIGRHLPAVGGAVHPAVVEVGQDRQNNAGGLPRFFFIIEVNSRFFYLAQVGLKFAEGTVTGSNARCVALLAALKKVKEKLAKMKAVFLVEGGLQYSILLLR